MYLPFDTNRKPPQADHHSQRKSQAGHQPPNFHQMKSAGAEKTAVHEKLASGEWRIPIEKIYPLTEVSEAHRAWEARELVGRTLIQSGGDL